MSEKSEAPRTPGRRSIRALVVLAAAMVRLAAPLPDELTALNAFRPSDWSGVTARLILGEVNQGREPYGVAFDRVAERLPSARTTLLPGQGHLAHVEDPAALGRLVAELLAE